MMTQNEDEQLKETTAQTEANIGSDAGNASDG